MTLKLKYTDYFCLKNRENSNIVCLNQNAPQELKDLVKDIHFDHFDRALPNDWIYSIIGEAFDALANDSIEDITVEADMHYHDLLAWLQNSFAADYCDEVREDGLTNLETTFYEMVGMAQYMAKRRIYEAVDAFINEQGER